MEYAGSGGPYTCSMSDVCPPMLAAEDDVCVVTVPGDGETPKIPALTRLMMLLSEHQPELPMPPDGGVSKANFPR